MSDDQAQPETSGQGDVPLIQSRAAGEASRGSDPQVDPGRPMSKLCRVIAPSGPPKWVTVAYNDACRWGRRITAAQKTELLEQVRAVNDGLPTYDHLLVDLSVLLSRLKHVETRTVELNLPRGPSFCNGRSVLLAQ